MGYVTGGGGSGGGAPTGAAGGELAGTYPNPTVGVVIDDAHIVAGGLTNAALAAAAAIANTKLATNPLARANHTGTQTMSTISDAGTLATKSAIASADITDGTIVTGDLSASAGITSGQLAGSIAASKITGTALVASNNLSDVTAATARANLALGSAALGATTDFVSSTSIDSPGARALSPTQGAPADLGLKGWTFDPAQLTGSFTLSSTTIYIAKMFVPVTITGVTNVEVLLANTPLGSSGAYAGIYLSTGTLLSGSADLHTTLNGATGRFLFPQTGNPITITGGSGVFVWLACLVVGASTAASMYRLGNAATTTLNYNLDAAHTRFGTYTSGSPTTLVAITPSSITQVGNSMFMGIS